MILSGFVTARTRGARSAASGHRQCRLWLETSPSCHLRSSWYYSKANRPSSQGPTREAEERASDCAPRSRAAAGAETGSHVDSACGSAIRAWLFTSYHLARPSAATKQATGTASNDECEKTPCCLSCSSFIILHSSFPRALSPFFVGQNVLRKPRKKSGKVCVYERDSTPHPSPPTPPSRRRRRFNWRTVCQISGSLRWSARWRFSFWMG